MRKVPKAFLSSIPLVLLVASPLARAQQPARASGSDVQSLPTIVERMEAAQMLNRENYRPYTMTRDYRLYGSDEQQPPQSEVIANVTFNPPSNKTFRIKKSEGSSRGESIVRHVLEHEVEAAAKNSKDAPGAITRKNYDFKLLGEGSIDGQPSWILQLDPKRSDKNLIRGKAWVDKRTYLIHRIEGDMAKTPSWWLRSVKMQISFAGTDGMWLQTGTHAVADVRIFGTHIFVGNTTEVQTANQVSRQFSSAPPDFLQTSDRRFSSGLPTIETQARNRRSSRRVQNILGVYVH